MITLNEVRSRAIAFSRDWADAASEAADKQRFWAAFFEVFGIPERRYLRYELPVSFRDGRRGRIDVFWPGLLLVEHKSRGGNLNAAFKQAADYFDGLEEEDLPRFVIVSDFERFRVYNMEDAEAEPLEFPLSQLHRNLAAFGFLTGHTYRPFKETPEVDVKAAELMSELHEAIRESGFVGHDLAVMLVRLMFCMFADHTGLFPRNLFRDYVDRAIRKKRHLGTELFQFFWTLDQPPDRRKGLEDELLS